MTFEEAMMIEPKNDEEAVELANTLVEEAVKQFQIAYASGDYHAAEIWADRLGSSANVRSMIGLEPNPTVRV